MNFHIVLKYVWGSHVDSFLRAVNTFHLSIAEMSSLGASLAVWSYLPFYTPFYFSISSMSTEASFIRTTNNEVPLTISSSSVFTKSIKSIFFVPKEMLLPKEGFADAGKLWKYAFNFSYFKSEKMNETYIPVQNCVFLEQLSLSFFFRVKSFSLCKKIVAVCNKFNPLFLETRVLLFISTLTTRCGLSCVQLYFFNCFFKGWLPLTWDSEACFMSSLWLTFACNTRVIVHASSNPRVSRLKLL